MHLTRLEEAKPYDAPGHMAMRMLRLQGREAGPAERLWLGISHILPGGGTTATASPQEKFYVLLEGELTVVTASGETILHPWDSCRIAPDEVRSLQNRSSRPCTVLLAMPLT